MMKHLILILSLLLFPAVAHAQCATNNNSNFTLSGTNNATLSSTTPLSQGQYTVGVVPTVSGTSNSGTTCYPVLITSGVGTCTSDGTAGGRGMPPNYPYSSDGAVTVNWNDCYQVIDGWGADFNQNWTAQTGGAGVTLGGMQGVYTLTNGNGGPGMGLTHMRWGCLDPGFASYATAAIQCSLPIGTNVCAQANYMTQLGGTLYWVDGLLYSHYFPNFNSIFATDIPTIASNTATWLGQFKSQCGGAIFFTYSLFNEESGTFQNTSQCQGYHDLIAALSSAFATAGIATKFALPEEASFGTGFATAACTMNDTTTAASVNVIDWHGYGNVNGSYPYQNLSKHGWMTEYDSSFATGAAANTWTNAQATVNDFMNSLEWGANLVEYQVGYCPTNQLSDTAHCFAFDQGGFDTFTIAAYAYGQLSRYIYPGWHLYGSTTSPYADGSVSTLFFRSPTTNAFTVVALNTATAARNLNVSFQGFTGTAVTPIETTAAGAQWAPQVQVSASSGFSFSLPAQSVTTFTGTGSPANSAPTISVNGLSTGVTAAAGSLLTIAVANGPGNPTDWMSICDTTTPPAAANCSNAYSWSYLNCGPTGPSISPPATGLTAAICKLTAPSVAGNYIVYFFSNNVFNILASAPLTVTGSGGGCPGCVPGQPFNNIACPRGCTWTEVFSDDFTTDTSFNYDQTTNVTNAIWYVPPDGTTNPTGCTGATNCTYSCISGGALDTSHLPGYLAFHAIGTLAWETSNNLSCGIFPKVSNTFTPVGCPNGWFTQSCTPIPGPVIYEYKAQLALNQIFEVQACCNIELYFYESRGNGTSFNGGIPHVIGGESVEVGNPVVELDNAPTVVDVLVDPQAGYTWYTNGVSVFSANPGNCPTGTCDGTTSTYYMFNDAISNACGGACSPGGTTQLYWVKEFQATTQPTGSVPGCPATGPCDSASILPSCPRGCTWAAAYNDDFRSDTTFNFNNTGTTANNWFVPPDGNTDGGSSSPSPEVGACSQMLDASTLPGYLSIHIVVGTLPWESPTPGGTVYTCDGIVPTGGAAGLWPGNGTDCGTGYPPAGAQAGTFGIAWPCHQLTGPVYYEYKMVPDPNHMDNVFLNSSGELWSNIPQWGQGTWVADYFMEARGNGTSVGSTGLPMLWPNNNHGRIQGSTSIPNWNNGDQTPHVIGFLLDPAGGDASRGLGEVNAYWDGTPTYTPSTCSLNGCPPNPDNCSVISSCAPNFPTAPAVTWSWACTANCSIPGTDKLYFVRAYVGK